MLLIAVIITAAIITAILIGIVIGMKIGIFRANALWQQRLPKIRKEAIQKSRAVLSGLLSEQLAPYLPDFPFKPTEARFIGKPIDFIVFEGLDEHNPQRIVFVEVKSGKSTLSKEERKIKDLIKSRKVSWHEYRINL